MKEEEEEETIEKIFLKATRSNEMDMDGSDSDFDEYMTIDDAVGQLLIAR